jgi:Tol biopolymer transport system component
MTSNERLERSVSVWLREDAAFRVPDHLEEVLAATRETRQRPAWSSLERWLPVDTTFRPRPFTMPSGARLVAVAAILLLIAAIAIFAVGSRQRLPAPFGIARNGIVITSQDGDLLRVDPSTSEGKPIGLGDGFDFSPIFSRDGTKFMFLRSDGQITEPAILTLYVANADGSGLRAVTPPTESLDWMDWSPDGTQIAYVAKQQLWVVDIATGEPRRIDGVRAAHFPTWSPPDGKEIFFRRQTRSPAILAVSPDGASEPRLVSKTLANNEADYHGFGVAPDGAHLTFTRWFENVPDVGEHGWLPRVFVLDVLTGGEMELSTEPGTGQLAGPYSPDGKLIAYARVFRTGGFQLVVANADGSGNERTVGGKRPSKPDGSDVRATWAFTPDGTALVVRYGTDDSGQTYLIPLDGSTPVDLGSGGFAFTDVQRLAP